MKDVIAVSLRCNIPNRFKDYMCGVQAIIKLVSSDDKLNYGCMTGVYDSENTNWGLDRFVQWKNLFQDDTITFEIELKVGPLENKDCHIMKTIKDKFEGEEVTGKLMEMVLNRIDDDFVGKQLLSMDCCGMRNFLNGLTVRGTISLWNIHWDNE